MKLLYEFTAGLNVPASRAAELLCAARPGPDGAWLLRNTGYVLEAAGPGRFIARSPGHRMTVEADVGKGFFAVQGGWWYRAEYIVEPAVGGTRLTQRIYNAATRGRWAVPLANRFFAGFEAQSRAQFEQLAADLGLAAQG